MTLPKERPHMSEDQAYQRISGDEERDLLIEIISDMAAEQNMDVRAVIAWFLTGETFSIYKENFNNEILDRWVNHLRSQGILVLHEDEEVTLSGKDAEGTEREINILRYVDFAILLDYIDLDVTPDPDGEAAFTINPGTKLTWGEILASLDNNGVTYWEGAETSNV